MWRISLRDLQFRRRRFTIAVAATSLLFAMTLLMNGMSSGLHQEVERIVDVIDVDGWIVASDTSGPFTAASVVPAAGAELAENSPGVEQADPIVILHSTMNEPDTKDINLIGVEPGGLGHPEVAEGAELSGPGEAIADTALGLELGQRVVLAGHEVQVVGTADNITYYFGIPTLFVTLSDAQDIAFSGQSIATAIVTKGRPESLPPGAQVLDDAAVRADLERPLENGVKSIDLMSALLWVTAAAIIGSMIYISVLERTRDFAVLKSTGTTNFTLMLGLALQAIVLSVLAAAIGALLGQVLGPLFPFQMALSITSYVTLFGLAVTVGLLASLAGLFRAVKVDPALAFGGA